MVAWLSEWWRPSYVRSTSLVKCSSALEFFPAESMVPSLTWATPLKTPVREKGGSVKRPGIVHPGWGVGKRNVGRTWVVRGLRERETPLSPHGYPLLPRSGWGSHGVSSCCRFPEEHTCRPTPSPVSLSQQILDMLAHQNHWCLRRQTFVAVVKKPCINEMLTLHQETL